jgi:hypothetical protein
MAVVLNYFLHRKIEPAVLVVSVKAKKAPRSLTVEAFR